MPKGGCGKCKGKKQEEAPLNLCAIVNQATGQGLALGMIQRAISPVYAWWEAFRFEEQVRSSELRIS